MPIYEYRCEGCGQVTEALVWNEQETKAVRCAQCGDHRLTRVYLSPIAPVPAAAKKAGAVTCCGEGQGCSDPKRCCQQ